MKKFSKAITSGDWFGHELSLNFQKSQRTHKTLIGGIISFLVKVFLLLLFACLFAQHVLSPSQVTISLKNRDDGETKFKNMNQKMYLLLFNSVTGEPLEYTQELQSYLSVSLVSTETDYTSFPFQSERTKFPAKKCSQQDFEATDFEKNLFESEHSHLNT